MSTNPTIGIEWARGHRASTTTLGIEWDGHSRSVRVTAAMIAAAIVVTWFAWLPQATSSDAPDTSVVVQAVADRAQAAEQLVGRLGGHIGKRLGIIDGFSATVPADRVDEIRQSPDVEHVTPDVEGHLMAVDPSLGYDPAADAGSPAGISSIINANSAYAAGVTGAGVDVALIDSGVVPVDGLTAPGKVINGPDLSFDNLSADLRYLDGFGHGTHMAGLIGGRDDADSGRFTGVAPDVRLLNVKVGSNDGSVDVSQVIAAIDWVVQHRRDNGMNVRVLNLSWGTNSLQDAAIDPLAHAVEVAWRKGIVVVVAGGNDGKSTTTLASPATDPLVIAVGASDSRGTLDKKDDVVADFSSKGNKVRHVDVLAPGRTMLSLRSPGSRIDEAFPTARVGTRFFKGSGTSQAAAITSGAAALLLQHRPGLTPDQVKQALMATATPINSGNPLLSGNGTINVGAAMAYEPTAERQAATPSTGTGSLEAARGSVHVVDPQTGVTLTGEKDIFGQAWNGAGWAKNAENECSWNGGSWNGSTWSGSTWSGTSWAGSTWSGSTWSGSTWSGSTWSSYLWTGSTWSGSTWSGSTWSGSTWSGSTWSGSTWSGSTWSGSTWSGSTWSGSTWSGSTWSGSTWSGSTWSGSTWSGAGWSDASWS